MINQVRSRANNSYDDKKYQPKQGITTYICSYCKIGRHDKCANQSKVLNGICGCVYTSCVAREKERKENGTEPKIS